MRGSWEVQQRQLLADIGGTLALALAYEESLDKCLCFVRMSKLVEETCN